MDIEKRVAELERQVSELSLASHTFAEKMGKAMIETSEGLKAAVEKWQKEMTERLKKLEVAAGLAKG